MAALGIVSTPRGEQKKAAKKATLGGGAMIFDRDLDMRAS